MAADTIKIMSIAGARPNFMKLASIARAVESYNQTFGTGRDDNGKLNSLVIRHVIVHTGQHYDQKMSHAFFDDLGIPKPDINLEVGSASHAVQTAEIMKRFESVLLQEQPDVLLVVGDVNSTIACTLVASKIEYSSGKNRKRPVIVHVEAGLRSFDRDMPEEINRLLTDLLSDLLFVTEQSGVDNLKNEGIAEEKIHFVGNVMIDTLITHLKRIKKSSVKTKLNIEGAYGLVTLHRPSNVDKRETLEPLMGCLDKISQDIPLYFAIHPRTLHSANKFNLLDCFNFKHYHEDLSHIGFVPPLSSLSKIYLMPPQGYLNFLSLITTATLVITDSGGIQEETTFLAIPCITLRENTERPVTIDLGSNYMVGTDPENILKTVRLILDGKGKKAKSPPLWDGNSGKRILKQIIKEVHSKSGSDV